MQSGKHHSLIIHRSTAFSKGRQKERQKEGMGYTEDVLARPTTEKERGGMAFINVNKVSKADITLLNGKLKSKMHRGQLFRHGLVSSARCNYNRLDFLQILRTPAAVSFTQEIIT